MQVCFYKQSHQYTNMKTEVSSKHGSELHFKSFVLAGLNPGDALGWIDRTRNIGTRHDGRLGRHEVRHDVMDASR